MAADPQEQVHESEATQEESPESMLVAFTTSRPNLLDACAEFVKPPTLQRMPPDRLKRIVAPATRAMQDMWRQLEGGDCQMTVEGMIQAIADAIFTVVDPDVVQTTHVLQDITDAGAGINDLAGESAVFARLAEIFAAGAQAVLEARPRVASMLLGEVAMYIQNLGEPLDLDRQTLMRTFASTAKFLDSIPGALAAVDGELDMKASWHETWAYHLIARGNCAPRSVY